MSQTLRACYFSAPHAIFQVMQSIALFIANAELLFNTREYHIFPFRWTDISYSVTDRAS